MHDFLPLNRISDRIILNFRKILYTKFFFLVVCLVQACMHAKSLQLCLTLCDPMDCSPPGSSCLWNSPGKILEWISIPFSRGSSQPRVESGSPALQADFFTVWATREAHAQFISFPFLLSFHPSLYRDTIFVYLLLLPFI